MHDDEGHQWGFQITLFTQILLNQQTYLYDVALSDLFSSQFLHFRGTAFRDVGDADELIFQDDLFRLALDDGVWLIHFSGDAPDMGIGGTVPLEIDLSLEPQNYDYYLHGPEGSAEMGECNGDRETFDGYTYYYSHPALTTNGAISVDNTTHSVVGDTWFDHQWGNFLHCNLAWNWFSLRFDDGSFMMLFQFLDDDGNPLPNLLGASYLDTDGTVTYWEGEDDVTLTPTRFWTHPEQKTAFGLEWTVETPVGTFGVAPYFDNQTPSYLAGIPYYWEGAMRVRDSGQSGQQIGIGYLEVVPRIN